MLPQVPILNQNIQVPAIILKEEKPEPKKPVEYVIHEGDTLTSISGRYSSSVGRFWAKNTQLTDPDVIKPGDTLIVPENDEPLPERTMPSTIQPTTPRSGDIPAGVSSSGLVGRIGYAIHTGNCVNTARAHGKLQPGNPISWVPNTQTPFIGAAALFHYNHVGIVVGIWPNGDLEIAHENYRGNEHRFPRSSFRGFF